MCIYHFYAKARNDKGETIADISGPLEAKEQINSLEKYREVEEIIVNYDSRLKELHYHSIVIISLTLIGEDVSLRTA